MIRPSDEAVNFAGVRLNGATYESPVDVAAGFEQTAIEDDSMPSWFGNWIATPDRCGI